MAGLFTHSGFEVDDEVSCEMIQFRSSGLVNKKKTTRKNGYLNRIIISLLENVIKDCVNVQILYE